MLNHSFNNTLKHLYLVQVVVDFIVLSDTDICVWRAITFISAVSPPSVWALTYEPASSRIATVVKKF